MDRTGNDCWCLSSMTKILAIPWSLCSEPLIVYRFHVTDSLVIAFITLTVEVASSLANKHFRQSHLSYSKTEDI